MTAERRRLLDELKRWEDEVRQETVPVPGNPCAEAWYRRYSERLGLVEKILREELREDEMEYQQRMAA